MEISGLLSNFSPVVRRAAEQRRRVLAAGPDLPELRRLRPRQGELKDAVLAVLAASDRPLRAQEIRREAEKHLGRPVILHSVITRLTDGVVDPKTPIVRAQRGLYQLAPIMPK